MSIKFKILINDLCKVFYFGGKSDNLSLILSINQMAFEAEKFGLSDDGRS